MTPGLVIYDCGSSNSSSKSSSNRGIYISLT